MKLVRLLFVPFALVIVGIIRLIAPWKLVRFGEHWDMRIGHLVGNTECYLCEKDVGIQPKAFDIWVSVGSSNKCIEKKYRKLLHIYPTWLVVIVSKVNLLFPGWQKHYISLSQFDRDIHNLWEKHSPHIGFTQKEELEGQKLLRSLGIPEKAKWVCLFVRDSAYLDKALPQFNWSYHDYRDSDIADCFLAVKTFIKHGYYVVRIGNVVKNKFTFDDPKYIDYTRQSTDFGTFYLSAKCEFFFGTSSGPMAIAHAFNRPVGMINYVPVEYLPTFFGGLAIWKHHIKEGKELNIIDIGEAGQFLRAEQFKDAGITLEDNTPEEINDLAEELCNRKDDPQIVFWEKFPRSMANGSPLHGEIRIRIGRKFLEAQNGIHLWNNPG